MKDKITQMVYIKDKKVDNFNKLERKSDKGDLDSDWSISLDVDYNLET